MEHNCPICEKKIYNHLGACYGCRDKIGVGKEPREREPNPRATFLFFKWGLPVILLLGAVPNYMDTKIKFFMYIGIVGFVWLLLAVYFSFFRKR